LDPGDDVGVPACGVDAAAAGQHDGVERLPRVGQRGPGERQARFRRHRLPVDRCQHRPVSVAAICSQAGRRRREHLEWPDHIQSLDAGIAQDHD
jgi:hypothetical protein